MAADEATIRTATSRNRGPLLRVRAIIPPQFAVHASLVFLLNANDVHPRLVVFKLVGELKEVRHGDGDEEVSFERISNLAVHRDIQVGIETTTHGTRLPVRLGEPLLALSLLLK